MRESILNKTIENLKQLSQYHTYGFLSDFFYEALNAIVTLKQEKVDISNVIKQILEDYSKVITEQGEINQSLI